jgi:hypothetical protein
MVFLSRRSLPVVGLIVWAALSGFSAAQQSPSPRSGTSGGVVGGSRARRPTAPPYSADVVIVRTQTLADGTTMGEKWGKNGDRCDIPHFLSSIAVRIYYACRRGRSSG